MISTRSTCFSFVSFGSRPELFFKDCCRRERERQSKNFRKKQFVQLCFSWYSTFVSQIVHRLETSALSVISARICLLVEIDFSQYVNVMSCGCASVSDDEFTLTSKESSSRNENMEEDICHRNLPLSLTTSVAASDMTHAKLKVRISQIMSSDVRSATRDPRTACHRASIAYDSQNTQIRHQEIKDSESNFRRREIDDIRQDHRSRLVDSVRQCFMSHSLFFNSSLLETILSVLDVTRGVMYVS